ncbi:MAG: hypothetical protein KDD66_14040 [Bdellovibrionales bacterium]|nr:hypothetical protein [Bdellovibrionales bacterium]
MFRVVFFLLLFTFGLTFVTGSKIGAHIGAIFFCGLVLYLVLKVAIDIWLHFRKREEDHDAFASVLGEQQVESYTNIDAYARRRGIKTSEREKR